MPKKPGGYYRPKNMNEALRLLSKPDTAPLAGGTQLLASEAGVSLAAVVDLQDLGIDKIDLDDQKLTIGAMVTLTELAEFLNKEMPQANVTSFLELAIKQAGPNTYRNSATVGGIVASRLPDSEFLAALLVLQSDVSIQRPDGEEISMAAYLAPEERVEGLITAVRIPRAEGWGHSERVARTPADYPIVSITSWQPDGGSSLLAATGLGQRPSRLETAEAQLLNGLTKSSIDAAAAAARDANTHPGDFRGDADYRAQMAEVLTRRVLLADNLPGIPD
jgi:carbon-monoxide dehydrogenase medium subunit